MGPHIHQPAQAHKQDSLREADARQNALLVLEQGGKNFTVTAQGTAKQATFGRLWPEKSHTCDEMLHSISVPGSSSLKYKYNFRTVTTPQESMECLGNPWIHACNPLHCINFSVTSMQHKGNKFFLTDSRSV